MKKGTGTIIILFVLTALSNVAEGFDLRDYPVDTREWQYHYPGGSGEHGLYYYETSEAGSVGLHCPSCDQGINGENYQLPDYCPHCDYNLKADLDEYFYGKSGSQSGTGYERYSDDPAEDFAMHATEAMVEPILKSAGEELAEWVFGPNDPEERAAWEAEEARKRRENKALKQAEILAGRRAERREWVSGRFDVVESMIITYGGSEVQPDASISALQAKAVSRTQEMLLDMFFGNLSGYEEVKALIKGKPGIIAYLPNAAWKLVPVRFQCHKIIWDLNMAGMETSAQIIHEDINRLQGFQNMHFTPGN